MKLDFKSIPKFCISLKRNEARRAEVKKEFAKHSLSVTMFDAVDKRTLIVPETSPKSHESHADGILACAMSHIKLIKYAKENSLEAICIFEDDVVLCDDFAGRIKYIENLPDFDFDILALGGHFSIDLTEQEAVEADWRYIKRVRKMSGTYALIFTAKTYDFILRNWWFGLGSDQLYSDHVYYRFKTFAFVPFLVGVKPNFSDILGVYWDYPNTKWQYQQHSMMEFDKKNEKKNLLDVTFIIPVRIESADREFNFLKVLQYLCDTFNTNIIIKEADTTNKVSGLLKQINFKGCDVVHLFEQTNDSVFHRTRFLNEMLMQVKTECVVNYDADVLLRPEAYMHARDRIIYAGMDLVYPYKDDPTDAQIQITVPESDRKNEDLNLFDSKYHKPWGSKCGHVQFFKTKSYIDGGMENEFFYAYAPEDIERMERFLKLGYKVEWLEDHQVYHIEHSRGPNSSMSNPLFGNNQQLLHSLRQMSVDSMRHYYKTVAYLKKYQQ